MSSVFTVGALRLSKELTWQVAGGIALAAASAGGVLISDNLLFPTDPFLDFGGFTFHAGSDRLIFGGRRRAA